MPKAARIPKTTIVIDLNKQRPDGEWEHAGYTMREAAQVAVDDGSDDAWEWFKAWFKGNLTRSDTKPGNW
ncbi:MULTISPECIES: ALF repeat-containing protein [unclassified Ensifer]|uniref:ALF repeat-containing protein n=1 Tax=unclassified Ensifer TaxID=2633371 RepID=UPI00081391FD|nr:MULTISPECIES: ALF repeat-containing protein [unclassified Ensifer]OCP21958.1 hypothetical protein BC361_25655 [Ensifer sp. LC54]OCP23262.1 hypothetical protein BC363_25110 [Ensifer sp. LC384]